METNRAVLKKANKGPGVRGPALLAICNRADAAMSAAYGSYRTEGVATSESLFKAAAECCMQASLRANKDGLNEWADEYGRKHADMNRKACGG